MTVSLPVAATVVAVVEYHGRYLMIEERRNGDPVWYFPSGALEAGESLEQATRREVREETGFNCEPGRIIAINHGAFHDPTGLFWWRFVVSARIRNLERMATNEPDVVSVEWVDPDEVVNRPLRSPDALELCRCAASGGGLPLDACILAQDGRLTGFFA